MIIRMMITTGIVTIMRIIIVIMMVMVMIMIMMKMLIEVMLVVPDNFLMIQLAR